MSEIAKRLNAYFEAHPFPAEDGETTFVLEQLYEIYAETHESDSSEITAGFRQLEEFLHALPLADNNAVFTLCCKLCSEYERRAFFDGINYGAHLIMELQEKTNTI